MIMIQSVSELLKVKKGKAGTVPSHIFCRSWRLEDMGSLQQFYYF